jgi:integrase
MAVVPFRKNVSWEDAAAEFIYFKMAEGRAERTIRDYKEHIARFFKRFPDAFDPARARKCVLEYMSDKIKPATYNIRLAYLKSFFSWCVNEGILPENPTAGLKRRKDEGRIVSVEDSVLVKLLELPDKGTFTGLRDYALILLTLDTGIRPGEALSLLPSDVNIRSCEVCVRAEVAKTRTRRTLPISPATAKAISKLLSVRHPEWEDDVPVFCSQDGLHMLEESWYHRLTDYSKRLGKHIRPYDLRHVYICPVLPV